MRALVLAIAVAACGPLAPPAAPTPPAPLLHRADLRADAAILRDALRALHPGLLRYQTAAEFEARYAMLVRDLDRDQPATEACLAMTRFTATIRCGHTYPNFFNQSPAITASVLDHRDRLPVTFRWLGDRMIVTRDLSGTGQLPPGAEIVAIDGTPTAAILAAMRPLARADGHNDAKRAADLEISGGATWEAFDVYWPLLYPGRGPRLRLDVRNPDSTTATVTVDATTSAGRRAALGAGAERDRAGPLWTLEAAGPELAILRMPSWVVYDSSWDWRAWLDATFAELAARAVPNLVIDLRGNEGGNDIGAALIGYLIDQPVERDGFEPRVSYRQAPAALVPYLDTWDPAFLDWGEAAIGPEADGRYHLVWADDDNTPVAPGAARYRGRVFALVGAANSSATFQFASDLQRLRLGTLVGQPTGGNQRGINGGGLFFVRLPHSGLEVDVPLVGQFPRTPRPDAGLLPDVRVDVTPADIAAGRDPELAAVRAILAGR